MPLVMKEASFVESVHGLRKQRHNYVSYCSIFINPSEACDAADNSILYML